MTHFVDKISSHFSKGTLVSLNDSTCLVKNSQNLPSKEVDEKIAKIGYCALFSEQRILGNLCFTLVPYKYKLDQSVVPLTLFEEIRAASPISIDAIYYQAKLHETLRKSQVCSHMNNLYEYKNVFRLYQSYPSCKTFAYYKERLLNYYDDYGIIEPIVWDLAVILGLEAQFIPTATVSIRSRPSTSPSSLTKSVTLTKKSWSPNFKEIIDKPLLSDLRKGSLQPRQKGILIAEYIKLFPMTQTLQEPAQRSGQKSIPRFQLIQASLTAAVLSFYDAHMSNILVDEEGNIKFFDNTCHMPHSNGVILWGEDHLRSSFRSCLLILNGSYVPFSPEERLWIEEELKKYETKLNVLKEYYNHPSTQSKINKLPKHWLQPQDSLEALHERIIRLKAGIANPAITNLCELSLMAQPHLRFCAAITCFFYITRDAKFPWKEKPNDSLSFSLQHEYLNSLGYESINNCIDWCCSKGFNPIEIKNLCDDPSLSFNEIIKLLCIKTNRIDITKAKEYGEQLIKELTEIAKLDCKDDEIENEDIKKD